ncbi:MAG TPA: TolC family protein [Flavobacteriales bacterium]|nr:TolC family protein [Flavobacteriales bacterium]HQW06255.1 TolC family protein [Flavobacteriales bacterium]HQX99892.1 TolC family protein [Flavobacteriales bacterium]
MLVNIHRLLLATALLVFALGSQAQQWPLEQCLDSARVNNRGLKMAQNEGEIATSRHQEAQYARIPKLIANGEYKYFMDLPTQLLPMSIFGGPEGQFKDAQFGVPHSITANLQLVMPIYDPMTQGAVRTTGIAEKLGEIKALKTEEQVVQDISALYYNAQVLHHQMAYLDSNIINSAALLNTLSLLRQQLLATGTDVAKVQLQHDQAQSSLLKLQSTYDHLLDLLRFSIGLPLDRPFDIVADVMLPTALDPATTRTLDQHMVGLQSDVLSSELRLLQQSRLPSLSLFGAYGTTGYGYDGSPNEFLDFYPLSFAGVSLKYPLFNGMVTRKKIEQKRLELSNSRVQVEQVDEKLDLDRKNASRQIALAESNLVDSRSRIALAEQVYGQVLLQQREGLVGLTEVLLADNALREAQQEHIAAMIDYLRGTLELQRVNGQLTHYPKN